MRSDICCQKAIKRTVGKTIVWTKVPGPEGKMSKKNKNRFLLRGRGKKYRPVHFFSNTWNPPTRRRDGSQIHIRRVHIW